MFWMRHFHHCRIILYCPSADKRVVVKNRTVEHKDRTKTKDSKGKFELLPELRELLLKRKQYQDENRAVFGKSLFNIKFSSDFLANLSVLKLIL